MKNFTLTREYARLLHLVGEQNGCASDDVCRALIESIANGVPITETFGKKVIADRAKRQEEKAFSTTDQIVEKGYLLAQQVLKWIEEDEKEKRF